MARSGSRYAPVLWIAFAAFAAIGAARAGPATGESQAVRQVILAQFQAFADDDADAAWQTATPAVRQQVGHPAHFLALVRGTYPMLYRPASIGFRAVELKGRRASQALRVVDASGQAWHVLFTLELQGDGSWRIGVCSVSEAPGQSA